jgi:hypothetical protein
MFSPNGRLTSLRIILTICALNQFEVHQMDVVRLKSVSKNLLLNGEGDDGGASSALLYYQKNKTTKFAWQFYL